MALLLLSDVALAATPRASSERAASEPLAPGPVAQAFDGRLATAWAEGDPGDGTGSTLELPFDKPVNVRSVSIWPGELDGGDVRIREFGRPRTVTVRLERASGDPVEQQVHLLDPASDGPLRHDVDVSADGVKLLKITFDEVYPGGIFTDLAVAEVAVNFTTGDPQPSQIEMATWLTTPAGAKAIAAHDARTAELVAKITSEQFGDRASLAELMESAQDGPAYLRERAMTKVPPGFRVQSTPPDRAILEQLLTLKDANAIPAIERAALRITGPLSAELTKRAKMFEAYQALLGAATRVAPAWGNEGFGKGQLQSLGEPLDVVVDNFGGLYVADVGNHRVQRYNIESGLQEKAWGAPADLTEVWFYKKRDFYASGSRPGTADGEFTHPVDLALIPGKDGDSVLVLDAKGRVTLLDPAGRVAKTTTVVFDQPIGPGGEGHVLFGKNKVVVVWGNEGAVLDFKTWAEVGRFSLEDGVPTGAVMLSNGKLALVYHQQLVMYSLDGFRHGDLMQGALGDGFQDWAVALDEQGKLWAVTDKGEVVKFKRPGLVDFRVPLTELAIDAPRIAVFDGLVFVAARDRIFHADALELQATAAAGTQTGTLGVP